MDMALVQSETKKVQIAMSVPSPRPLPLAGEGDNVSRMRHLG